MDRRHAGDGTGATGISHLRRLGTLERMCALEAGELVAERYELGPRLRGGGMADVHAGTDRRLGRDVAIKLLRAEMAARADVRRRFETEALAAAGLAHPNAVAVFDAGEHEGTPYIVMERLPGETVADRIAAGPVDPEWLRRVALDVLGALGAAHAQGVLHRDVKPGNILLTSEGSAKIADFGIAKTVGSETTSAGHLIGTPAYLAPERLEGGPASPASDLYSLGVVLYEGLAGRKPFTGATPVAIAGAIRRGTHPPLPEVRPDLDARLTAAVERAMAHDPSARFQSAAAMAEAIGAGVTSDATEVLPFAAGAAVESAAARRRPRWAMIAAIAAGLLLLAGLVGASGGDGTSGRPPAVPTTVVTAPPTTVAPPPTEVPEPEPRSRGKGNGKGNRGGGNED
jgi:serine/threonine-protein kinase